MALMTTALACSFTFWHKMAFSPRLVSLHSIFSSPLLLHFRSLYRGQVPIRSLNLPGHPSWVRFNGSPRR